MSYQTYGSSQHHHRQSKEYGAPRRKRGQSSRHQHAAWSSDYISEPVYASSDDYISPQNQHPTSAQYKNPSMSSAYRPRQGGSTLNRTSSQNHHRHEPRRTPRQSFRTPEPGPDYIPHSARTEDEYSTTPARTIPGAFVEDNPDYYSEYSDYEIEDSSSLQHPAPGDYDGRREVYDSPPYVERAHCQHPKKGGRGHKSGFQKSHGVRSHKLENYQEAKQFLDRFQAFDAQNNRHVDDPSDEEYDHSDYESDWHDQHAYNARSDIPDDFQAVKEALERIRSIGAPKPPPTRADYAPRDETNNRKSKKQSAAPRRRPKELKVPTEQRRWDVPNTSRRRAPQPRLDDYREAKQFLARFQALEAKFKREEEEQEEKAERSDEEEYISESASDIEYSYNEPRKQIAYSHVVEPEPEPEREPESESDSEPVQQQRWDAPHGATRRSRREQLNTDPAPSTTVANQARSPSPPASDIASYRSTALSGPPSRVPSTARSYQSRSRSCSPSVHSQASDCCSIPPSASASAPPSPGIQPQPQTHTSSLPLPSYSSFSRPPVDAPRPHGRSRGRSHSQASNGSSIPGSASRPTSPAPAQPQNPRRKQHQPTPLSYPYSCSSFSRPPQDRPRSHTAAHAHSRSRSRNNGIRLGHGLGMEKGRGSRSRSPSKKDGHASDASSDDNGIAEGSDYLPSDTDPGSDAEHSNTSHTGRAKHVALSDDNGVAEGSDYLSSGDDGVDGSDVCSARGGKGGRSGSGDDDDDDDEGDYMSAEDEGMIGERYYGR